MTNDEIKAKAASFGGWYHAVQLLPDEPSYFTPLYRNDIAPQWDMTRLVRANLWYKDARVLDIGTMDGMWAFEAERLGAKEVTTIDIWQDDKERTAEARFNFARDVLKSRVGFCEDSVEDLSIVSQNYIKTWDIIQCLGVLYHVENPLLALRKMWFVARRGAKLLLETAVWPGNDAPIARFNSDSGIYHDPTTFWAMNRACLYAALRMNGWEPDHITERSMRAGSTERVCLICEAT